MIRASAQTTQKVSYRWVVNAFLTSIIFAVVLACVIFLVNVIPSAMHSSETGWWDFTQEQMSSMKLWFFILLGVGVVLIFFFFFQRRRKYLIWG